MFEKLESIGKIFMYHSKEDPDVPFYHHYVYKTHLPLAVVRNILKDLSAVSKSDLQIEIIAQFLSKLAREKRMKEYREIQRAIEIMVERKGVVAIHELARLLNISARTLRRKFNYYIGISPKKFAKIIQFQTSVQQISKGSFSKLTDVVYENGYADQSHFIRNIKKFTGKRPLQLKSMQ